MLKRNADVIWFFLAVAAVLITALAVIASRM